VASAVHLEIEAGGRRRVLRNIVPALLGQPDIHRTEATGFRFSWRRDQPLLCIRLLGRPGQDARFGELSAMVEQTLDVVMARHPWDDAPLIDWKGAGGIRRLSVRLTEGRDADFLYDLLDPDIHRLVVRQLTTGGSTLKLACIHILRDAFQAHPDLRPRHEDLIRLIPAGALRQAAEVANRPLRPCEGAAESGEMRAALREALGALPQANGEKILQAFLSCLAFRSDELAYLKLIATRSPSSPTEVRNGH
jgi:hypothetical protein